MHSGKLLKQFKGLVGFGSPSLKRGVDERLWLRWRMGPQERRPTTFVSASMGTGLGLGLKIGKERQFRGGVGGIMIKIRIRIKIRKEAGGQVDTWAGCQ